MSSRKGQLGAAAIAGIIENAIILGAITAGVFFLQELIKLIQVILNSILYLSVFSIITIVGGGILFMLVRQETIGARRALVGFIILLTAAFSVPFVAGEVKTATTSWQAEIQVRTSEAPLGIGKVRFDGIKVVEVKRAGPAIFTGKQACSFFCGDYTVEITVTCEGMDNPKVVTVTGTTNKNPTKTVGPLPANSQCKAVGVMKRPADHTGKDRSVVSFITR